MKASKISLFIFLFLLLTVISSYFSYQRLANSQRKGKKHPLDLLPSLPNEEALALRRAKDLLVYGKAEAALRALDGEFQMFRCWKEYFQGLSLLRLKREEGWRLLLGIPGDCPPRRLALRYVLSNAPTEELKKIPASELTEEERAELNYRLGKLKPEEVFCNYPGLADRLKINIRREGKECRRRRFSYFFSTAQWARAYREALTVYDKARAAFYWRKYRRVLYLLRRPRNPREALLLFRAYLRAGQKARALRMRWSLKRLGLGEEFLWKMAMYYYPEERGFQLFQQYLRKYPSGKYSSLARRYLELREKCLKGKGIDEEGVSYVDFNLPEPSERELEVVRRAGLLSSAFLYREAMAELKFALKKDNSPLLKYYLGVVYYRAGDYLKGLRAIISAFGGIPRDLRTLKLIYPFPMRDKIESLALLNGIDPFLAAALIHQESLFNPWAHSYAGAIGLVQLTRRTFSSTVSRMGAGFSNPWDPHENLTVGLRHFSELLNYYQGQVEYALAAYNAGIERVDRWRTYLPCAVPSTFVELIPIEQTRNYVKSIKRKWRIYRRLYSESSLDFRGTLFGARNFHNIR